MPLTLSDNSELKSKSKGNGIFIDECTVIAVEDLSNYPKKRSAEIKTLGNSGFQPELCLKLRVNKGIEMDMYIFGKYSWKTDPISGKKLEYIGWKATGNAVQNLLVKLFGTTTPLLNDDHSIMPHILSSMIGRKFYALRYCQTREKMYEGKPSFQTWTIFAPFAEGEDEKLYKEFLKVAPNLTSYDPHLYNDYIAEQRKKEETFDPSQLSENTDSVSGDSSSVQDDAPF